MAQNNDWRKSLRFYKNAYEQGKQDALKYLPKWKKATEYEDLKKLIAILKEDKVLLSNYLEEGAQMAEGILRPPRRAGTPQGKGTRKGTGHDAGRVSRRQPTY